MFFSTADVSFTTSYGGYSWKFKTNKEITGGYASSKRYTTLKKAMKACTKNKKCTGVQWIGKKKYYLLKGSKEKKARGKKFWFKEGKKYTAAGKTWSMYPNHKIPGAKLSKTKYTDLPTALMGT